MLSTKVMLSTKKKGAVSLALSLMIALSLIINAGVVAAAPISAPIFDEAEESEECPASLMFLGEELRKHIPDPPSGWAQRVIRNIPDLPSDWAQILRVLRFLGTMFPDADWLLRQFPALDRLPSLGSAGGKVSANSVPVINQVTGVVIGFVPVVGDVTDGLTIVTGQDQITGECITRLNQTLLALGIGASIVFMPLRPVRGVAKIVGKPLIKALPRLPQLRPHLVFDVGKGISRTLVRIIYPNPNSVAKAFKENPDPTKSDVLDEARELADEFGYDVLFRTAGKNLNIVAGAFKGTQRLVGKGATSSEELLKKFAGEGHKIKAFTKYNYKRNLKIYTGVDAEAVKNFHAHHVLPQEFEESFRLAGIDTIHDPRLLVWVKNQQMRHKEYNDAWRTFFEQNPSPTKLDVLREARELADEFRDKFGYDDVLFKIPGWNPFERVRWPFDL